MTELTNPKPDRPWKKLVKRCLVAGAIVGGISSVLLLGSWLSNRGNKGPAPGKSEARMFVGAMNRAQEAHYLELKKFATSVNQFPRPFSPQTDYYVALTVSFRDVAFNYALSKTEGRRSRVGGVFVGKNAETGDTTTFVITCEAKQPGTQTIEPPINAKTCGAGTERVDR